MPKTARANDLRITAQEVPELLREWDVDLPERDLPAIIDEQECGYSVINTGVQLVTLHFASSTH